MAEEKISKSEEMNESELEQVAGGYNHETAQDSRFLNDLGTGCDRYGAYRVSIDGDAVSDVVTHWAKYGVDLVPDDPLFGDPVGLPNAYYINDQRVSRVQAMEHVMQVMGKSVDINKYM